MNWFFSQKMGTSSALGLFLGIAGVLLSNKNGSILCLGWFLGFAGETK